MSSDFSGPEALSRRIRVGAVRLTVARHAPPKSEPVGPDAIHIKAQDRTVAAGGKLNDQEKLKRDEHPFDAYPRLVKQAENNEAPKPQDNFRWRYYGIFYVAPTRLRICAACGSRTAFSSTGSSPAWPTSPIISVGPMRM
jgi:ferredoxin-nitrite reductase